MMARVIHIIGAPATGKSTLRKRLEVVTGLPSIAIDDERVKVLRPGEIWPTRDDLAWKALEAHIAAHPISIVETSGLSPNSAKLLAGHEVLTVICKADAHTRLMRLRNNARQGGPMIGNPDRYVANLYHMSDPAGPADLVWQGDSGSEAEFGAIWIAAEKFAGLAVA